MESKKKERANYSLDFKLKVLADMYENGLSIFGAAKKFGIKNHYSVDYWEKTYILWLYRYCPWMRGMAAS